MNNEPNNNDKTYLGHRTRVRNVIRQNGIEVLPPYQILEYILFHAIPRKDTKGIAYQLLDKFGSFSNVLLADVNDLAAVPNMTENAAILLHSLPGILAAFQKSKNEPKSSLATVAFLPYLKSLFDSETYECLQLLCFDAKKQLLHVDKISDGTPASVQVPVKKIAELVIRHHAHSVLLVHNHPSDNVTPSSADNEVTNNVHLLLNSMGIDVLDHIIIGSEYAYSLAMRTCIHIEDGVYPTNRIF